MRSKITVVATVCILLLVAVGCSKATLNVAVSGDSVVVEYLDDGVRQLITEDDDVKILEDSFSGEYEEVSSFKEDRADYIFYFGNDMDIELNSPEEYVSYMVLDGIAYAIDGEKVYKSSKEVDLSVLDKYRTENPDND